jgi:pimeloyl-ACP methyl ester carboxylesterase
MKPHDLAEALIRTRRRPGEAITPDETLKAAGFTIALHVRGDRPASRCALLVHGWEADHRDMLPLAAALAAIGFCVLMPDLPAHGASSGETVMIPEAVSMLVELGNRYGDFDLCVGHSVGSTMTLVALGRGLRGRAAALLAPPLNYVR